MGNLFVHPMVAVMTEADYQQRAKILSLTSKKDIEKISQESGVTFLDVRREDEVAEKALGRTFVNVPCATDDTSNLSQRAEELLPDKSAPIIIFCKSGRRAKAAKEALASMEYTKVYNAGGLGLDVLVALGEGPSRPVPPPARNGLFRRFRPTGAATQLDCCGTRVLHGFVAVSRLPSHASCRSLTSRFLSVGIVSTYCAHAHFLP